MVFNAKSAVPHQRAILIALLAAAVLVRVGVRVAFGEEYFWTGSYDIYYGMAKNIASGSGFSTFRPPLYPLFLAVTTLAGKSYLLIILPQALMGAGTALCAFLIGRHLFGSTAGLLACGMNAFYPYYVMHDTALQETGMVTFSVWRSQFGYCFAPKRLTVNRIGFSRGWHWDWSRWCVLR